MLSYVLYWNFTFSGSKHLQIFSEMVMLIQYV